MPERLRIGTCKTCGEPVYQDQLARVWMEDGEGNIACWPAGKLAYVHEECLQRARESKKQAE